MTPLSFVKHEQACFWLTDLIAKMANRLHQLSWSVRTTPWTARHLFMPHDCCLCHCHLSQHHHFTAWIWLCLETDLPVWRSQPVLCLNLQLAVTATTKSDPMLEKNMHFGFHIELETTQGRFHLSAPSLYFIQRALYLLFWLTDGCFVDCLSRQRKSQSSVESSNATIF